MNKELTKVRNNGSTGVATRGNTLWDDFFSPLDHFNSLGWLSPFYGEVAPSRKRTGTSSLGLRMDIKEESDRYLVESDVPGFTKDEINIDIDDGVLTISGTKEESKEENGDYILRERRSSHFSRSITLDNNVDIDKIKASCRDGVLSLDIPKKNKKEKKIKIEVK